MKARTTFTKLNVGWNAEPNAPDLQVYAQEDLSITFLLNAYQYPGFKEGDLGQLLFRQCWRYRFGPTNDEGWYRGQCRFSGIAPAWGEFYEVSGDLLLDRLPFDWVSLGDGPSDFSRHFLFYFRDGTFECDASNWEIAFKKSPSGG